MPPDSAADALQGATAGTPPSAEAVDPTPKPTGWEALEKWIAPAAPAATATAEGTTPEPEAPAEARPRRRLFRRRRPEQPVAATEPAVVEATPPPEAAAPDGQAPASAMAPPAAPRERPGVLRRRRRDLEARLEQGLFDIGGLALEMHRRDLVTDDVIRRRAAEMADLEGQIHQIDARLDQIRDERRVEREGGRGAQRCPVCATPFRAGANFCWNCGTQLQEPPPGTPARLVPAGPEDQPTGVITPAEDAQPTGVIGAPPGGAAA